MTLKETAFLCPVILGDVLGCISCYARFARIQPPSLALGRLQSILKATGRNILSLQYRKLKNLEPASEASPVLAPKGHQFSHSLIARGLLRGVIRSQFYYIR